MIGRDQKPQKAVPTASGGIPIGFFTEAVRNQIQLPDPAREILKLTKCFEEPVIDLPRDPRKFEPLIRSELRALTVLPPAAWPSSTMTTTPRVLREH
jgi:hypothetical protein